jgi:DNA-binding GntR family transcriptional regulator
MISRDAPQPPYEQLAGIIRGQIERGELKAGDRIPPILELAGTYGVAASTVRKSIRLLKAEGVIEGRPGWGMFVRQPG